jgi:hypothetical protein
MSAIVPHRVNKKSNAIKSAAHYNKKFINYQLYSSSTLILFKTTRTNELAQDQPINWVNQPIFNQPLHFYYVWALTTKRIILEETAGYAEHNQAKFGLHDHSV